MEVNGERWYIYCGGCDGWWMKMVLTVLQVGFGFLYIYIYIFEVLDELCVWIEL